MWSWKFFASEVTDAWELRFFARISRPQWPALSNYIAFVELVILSRALLGLHAITIRHWGQKKLPLLPLSECRWKQTIRIAAIARFPLRGSPLSPGEKENMSTRNSRNYLFCETDSRVCDRASRPGGDAFRPDSAPLAARRNGLRGRISNVGTIMRSNEVTYEPKPNP